MSTYMTILGIDPGMTTTGYSIGHYFPENGNTHIQTYGIIEAIPTAKKENKQDYKTFSKIIALDVYYREIKAIMEQHKVDYTVSESAFYNPRMPNAFLSLSLCIHTIGQVLYHEFKKPLYTIAPKAAKEIIFGSGTANKQAVQEGIMQHEDLIIKNCKTKPLEKMVEHEADSIAILYSFTKLILPDLLLQTKI